MSTAYSGDGITFPDNSVQATAPRVGMVNRIINGDMRVSQRNAGAAVTPTTNATYTLDRWDFLLSASSKFSTQQSSIAPAGFSSSNLVTSLSSYSSLAGDYFGLRQKIEGFNISDLSWGTAGASPVTLSFWVRSSLTGSFGGSIISTGASSYSYPFLYTINSVNTWEQLSVSVPANTFNTPSAGNASALEICFDLGTGSNYSGTAGAWANSYKTSATGATSVVGTNGATFYVTGVQLEKGSTATDFEYVDYSRQLQMCQRYHQKVPLSYGSPIDTSQLVVCYQYPVVMRANPTVALLTTTPYAEVTFIAGYTAGSATIQSHSYVGACDLKVAGFAGLTVGRTPMFLDRDQVSLTAEL